MQRRQTTLFQAAGLKQEHRRFKRVTHGGAKAKGKSKEARPICTRRTMHLILKSQRARGEWSFLKSRNKNAIEAILRKQAKKFGVAVHDSANVGTHLHLKIKATTRKGFQSFLRSVTCMIARAVTGARRGRKLVGGAFWQDLAYTRVVTSSLEELQLLGYFEANRREAKLGKEARLKFLGKFNAWSKSFSDA